MSSPITGTVNVNANTTYSDVDADDALFNINSATIAFVDDDMLADVTFAGIGKVINDGAMTLDAGSTGLGLALQGNVTFMNSGLLTQTADVDCGADDRIDNLLGATWSLENSAIDGSSEAAFNNFGQLNVANDSTVESNFYDTGIINGAVGANGDTLILQGAHNVIDGTATDSLSAALVLAGSGHTYYTGSWAPNQLTLESGSTLWVASNISNYHLVTSTNAKLEISADASVNTEFDDTIEGIVNGDGSLGLSSSSSGFLPFNVVQNARLWGTRITGGFDIDDVVFSTADLQLEYLGLDNGARLEIFAGHDSLGSVGGNGAIYIASGVTVAGTSFQGARITNDGVLKLSGEPPSQTGVLTPTNGPASLFGTGVVDLFDDDDVTFHYVSAGQVLDFASDTTATATIAPFGFGGAIEDLGGNTIDIPGSWSILGYQANDAGTGGSLTLSNNTSTVNLSLLGDYSASGFATTPGPAGITALGYHAPAG